MMLTGLVKLIIHARGARRATRRPYSTIGGMVRTAIAKPAGPIVSWPMMSCAMAVGFVLRALRGAADADAGDDKARAVDGGSGVERDP